MNYAKVLNLLPVSALVHFLQLHLVRKRTGVYVFER